ncbi:XdhC family protein [Streptomyces sp. NPDC058420]|uniref:XdhC family protein n=1 Tax=Streptomyces sp. NPDC058420 TaxID=3346489 RepID=UPI0036496868
MSVHDDEVERAGLTCGGQAEILLQPLDTVPAHWWDLLAEGADAALITRLDATQTQAVRTVVTPGDIVPEGPAQAVERARELLVRRRAGRDARFTDAGLGLIESFPAVPPLVIVGGGELAELLVAQAHLLGGQATVTATATAEDADGLLAERPAAACLIVLSHERDVDVPVLHTALTTGIAYVAAPGSRRTQTRRADALARAGLDEEQIARVHGPIGLDLGARTPAETAFAVCAEVLAALDGRAPRILREGTGPINA